MSEQNVKQYVVAKIDEKTCIGCTKCIDACPFDAILGANQQLHTVIEDYCIGCKLCVPACPVDCITLVDFPMSPPKRIEQAKLAKNRFQARELRLKSKELIKAQKDAIATQINFEDAIAASINRAKQKNNRRLFSLNHDHE